MGTPFITHLEPPNLNGYRRDLPAASPEQPSHIPPVFVDAMAVREVVFVREQGVPLEYEHDADDARSHHWVIYASVQQHSSSSQPQPQDPGRIEPGTTAAAAAAATGEDPSPEKTQTATTTPIGTLRVVPFPHPPHPRPGARYVDNVEQQQQPQQPSSSSPPAPAPAPPLTQNRDRTDSEARKRADAAAVGVDRATAFHDGREPYVKLGRMAVVPEFRGRRIAGQLWSAARQWLEAHPAAFNPSVAGLGMDQLRVGAASEIPKWNGLVCVHAQETAVRLYEKWGFQVDEGMGKWFEEGIPHVGMFQRLQLQKTDPII
ncbi:hypothetical protein F4780DRAFT_216527 [Xylariomycetidae sp. FL0641]|nr:hypothetical protein F4780DRAFT_216527 [Xylariomycetidae sp. FL0641]